MSERVPPPIKTRAAQRTARLRSAARLRTIAATYACSARPLSASERNRQTIQQPPLTVFTISDRPSAAHPGGPPRAPGQPGLRGVQPAQGRPGRPVLGRRAQAGLQGACCWPRRRPPPSVPRAAGTGLVDSVAAGVSGWRTVPALASTASIRMLKPRTDTTTVVTRRIIRSRPLARRRRGRRRRRGWLSSARWRGRRRRR